MSDYLQPQDLIDDKKHSTFFAEVITGKAGGVAGGASIDTATNAVTSQAQKTMPKIMVDAESTFDAQLSSQQSEFDAQLQAQGWNPVSGSFEAGGTIVNRRDILWWEAAKAWYSWQGTLPKVVPPGSTPATAGGVSPTAWVDRTDGALRTELASDGGAQLVSHKTAIADAVSITIADYIDLQPITPEMFGADGTLAGDTTALKAAFAFALIAPSSITLNRIYQIDEALSCYYVQTHNKGFSLKGKHSNCGIEWKGDQLVTSYVVDVHGYDYRIGGFRVIESSGAAKVNTGIRVCGEGGIVDDVIARGRWRYGVLGVACLKGSKFLNVNGSLMPSGTAAESLEGVPLQLCACVNAEVSGLLSNLCEYPIGVSDTYDSANAVKPPSLIQPITWGCEGVTVTSSKSAGTRYGPRFGGIEIQSSGCVWDLIHDKFCFLDGASLKVTGSWFGAASSTPTTVNAFPKWSTGGSNITFTGNTVSMGAASALVTPTTASSTFHHAYSDFSGNHIENFQCYVNAANRMTIIGNCTYGEGTPEIIQTSPDTVGVFIPQRAKSRLMQGVILGQNTPDGDGKLQIRADSGQRFFNMLTAAGNVLSTCPGGLGVNTVSPSNTAVLYVGSMASSNRSVNAVGTVNASGSDYAEYMLKSAECGTVEKGQVVGITSDAEITDRYDLAVSFAIKSTAPSIVGGDTWGRDLAEPVAPQINPPTELATPVRRYGQSDIEYAEILSQAEQAYAAELAEYELVWSEYEVAVETHREAYEAERIKYDRVAFCGQVPCSVDAAPGDYIIPTRGEAGDIVPVAVAEPTLQQYIKSVGQCWSGTVDGKAIIAVKIS